MAEQSEKELLDQAKKVQEDAFYELMNMQTKFRTYSKIFDMYSCEIGGNRIDSDDDKYRIRNEIVDLLTTFSLNFSDISESLLEILNKLER